MYDRKRGCVRGEEEPKSIKALRSKLDTREVLVDLAEKARNFADTVICVHGGDSSFPPCICKERQTLRKVLSKADKVIREDE
jgi:hypothetical protein